MSKRLWMLSISIIGGLVSSVPASADILYNNGPINGNLGGIGIGPQGTSIIPLETADSFTLTSESTLTGVTLGLWAIPGSIPISVQWGISTSPDFTNSAGGGGTPMASLSNTIFCTPSATCGEGVWDVYTSMFSLPDVTLAAGTYYLSLQGAATSDGNPLVWDDNNGPSVAYDGSGPLFNYGGSGTSNSESFQIIGIASVPEASMTLVDSAALACIFWAIGAGRRTRKQTSELRSTRL